jgi:hypothetical protein
VEASGSPPLSYQWLKNGVNIPGATNQTLVLPLIQAEDSGSIYTVSVSNALGTVTSSGATLTVVSAQHPDGVFREVYLGVAGSALSGLTNDLRFPNNPSYADIQPTFETPTDFAEFYGQRMRALLVPPATGDYTFWIASDDASVLYLSTDETPVEKSTIASVGTWTSFREWTKETNQQSAPITLNAGQRYYIEALHKEGGGGDHLTVRWRLPDNTIEEPIPGTRLQAYGPGAPSITGQPAGVTTLVGGSANFSVQAVGVPPLAYQWFFNQTNLIAGATNSVLSLTDVQASDVGGYTVVISNSFGSTTSMVAILMIHTGPALVSDFNSGLPAGSSIYGNAVVEGGYLKLTTAVGSQSGAFSILDFGDGLPVSRFYATFKAVLWGSTCCGGMPADGLSFNLVPAGTDPNSFTDEEGENSGLAVC